MSFAGEAAAALGGSHGCWEMFGRLRVPEYARVGSAL